MNCVIHGCIQHKNQSNKLKSAMYKSLMFTQKYSCHNGKKNNERKCAKIYSNSKGRRIIDRTSFSIDGVKERDL